MILASIEAVDVSVRPALLGALSQGLASDLLTLRTHPEHLARVSPESLRILLSCLTDDEISALDPSSLSPKLAPVVSLAATAREQLAVFAGIPGFPPHFYFPGIAALLSDDEAIWEEIAPVVLALDDKTVRTLAPRLFEHAPPSSMFEEASALEAYCRTLARCMDACHTSLDARHALAGLVEDESMFAALMYVQKFPWSGLLADLLGTLSEETGFDFLNANLAPSTKLTTRDVMAHLVSILPPKKKFPAGKDWATVLAVADCVDSSNPQAVVSTLRRSLVDLELLDAASACQTESLRTALVTAFLDSTRIELGDVSMTLAGDKSLAELCAQHATSQARCATLLRGGRFSYLERLLPESELRRVVFSGVSHDPTLAKHVAMEATDGPLLLDLPSAGRFLDVSDLLAASVAAHLCSFLQGDPSLLALAYSLMGSWHGSVRDLATAVLAGARP